MHGEFIEAQTFQESQDFETDVCVIGSGPGGAMAAALWAQAGAKVIVLESGGLFTRQHFRQREDEALTYFYQQGGLQATANGHITILQGHAVGGGSLVNWTTSLRMPSETLQHWKTHHHVNHIDESLLSTWYDVVEKRLSVTKVALENVNKNNRLLWEGCHQLGYQCDTTSRNVKGCAETGSCGHGCPLDAKQSSLLTYLQDAVAHGARIISRVYAQQLVYRGSNVEAVEAYALNADGIDRTGVKIRVRAKRFVLAAGAIHTPALLMRSNVLSYLGARVGERTFLHPTVFCSGEYSYIVNGHLGAPQSVKSHHFASSTAERAGFFLETAPSHPMLAAIAMPFYGMQHKEAIERLAFRSAHIALCIDGHGSDIGGQVKIDAQGHGVLHYALSPRLHRTCVNALQTLVDIQWAAGAHSMTIGVRRTSTMTYHEWMQHREKWKPGIDDMVLFSAHQMGGCRMGDEIHAGIVDSETGRMHGLYNVHITDGSVFPTALGVNPQLTIYAIAGLLTARAIQKA